MAIKTLNIIGAGRAGCTLAALWRRRGVYAIGSVLNRSRASAQAAVALIGAGEACDEIPAMGAAHAWLIATPDGQIAGSAARLAASGVTRAGDVVFHLSGALASGILREHLPPPVAVASVHPLKSFADARAAAESFTGTWCAAEGDDGALALLTPAFEAIGARVTRIAPQNKTLYHTASVIVCNYLTALMEAGLRCYEQAGLSRDTAASMMEPLVRETVDNVFKLGTAKALTGPIARGDHAVVARQLEVLRTFDPRIAELYRALGVIAAQLAKTQGGAGAGALETLQKLLDGNKPAGA